mgnify:FL=1
MSSKCTLITFGKTNRFLILILIGGILRTSLTFVESFSKFFSEQNLHPIIYTMTYSIGLSLSFIFFIIYKILSKSKKIRVNPLQTDQLISHTMTLPATIHIRQITIKEKFLWILLTSVIDFIAYSLFCIYWINFDNYVNTWAFTMIFMSLFSRWILKIKLYKHHYLGIIIIVVFGFLYNIIIGKFSKEKWEKNYADYLIDFLTETLFSFMFVMYKFLMDKKYIKSYEILFIEGIIEFILGVITLTITTKTGILDNYYDFIEQVDKYEINLFIIITFIQFLLYSFEMIIIDIFSPFHVFLVNVIRECIIFFIFFDTDNLAGSIFVAILIFICIFMILVFIEFIELNFLGLSTMTKKNIELRAQLDVKLNNKDEEKGGIEYQGGYIVNMDDEKRKDSEEYIQMDIYSTSE